MTATELNQILDSHPGAFDGVDRRTLQECIETCAACAQACTACADACLAEAPASGLIANIRASLDCADICTATSRVLSRDAAGRVDVMIAMLQACIAACRTCRNSCGSAEGDLPHAEACRLACERCAESCGRLLKTLGA